MPDEEETIKEKARSTNNEWEQYWKWALFGPARFQFCQELGRTKNFKEISTCKIET